MSTENLVGRKISGYEVIGQEHDGYGEWIGADLSVDVPPLGRFLLRLVTKKSFADEHLKDWQEGLEAMSPDDFDDNNVLPTKLPFVLNDEVITDEVLATKFGQGRIIKQDLANSMWSDIENDDTED